MSERHGQEVERLATLLRKIADDIEDNPSRITWEEWYTFNGPIGELNLDLDYRGDLGFLADQLEKLD